MMQHTVICDLCRKPITNLVSVAIGGVVHVCFECNQGAVGALVRAVLNNWPRTTGYSLDVYTQQSMLNK